jgi:hypothetical protein
VNNNDFLASIAVIKTKSKRDFTLASGETVPSGIVDCGKSRCNVPANVAARSNPDASN